MKIFSSSIIMLNEKLFKKVESLKPVLSISQKLSEHQ